MDITLKSLWTVILALVKIAADSYTLECKSVDRNICWCYEESDYTKFVCPVRDGGISVSVSKKNRVTLKCTSFVDLDVIPNLDLSKVTVFNIISCYLNTSLTDIIKKLNVQNIKTLNLEDMRQDDKIVTLTKESFQSLQGLERLTISDCTFRFAKDFLANTPNLLKFSLTKSRVNELDDYFKQVPKLKILELSGNQISVLPDGIFQNLSNLTKLDLFNNSLTSLSRNTFTGLKNLNILKLGNNHIQELSEYAFADLHNLVDIDLTGNRIGKIHNDTEAISENTFLYCPNLEKISLKSNLLTYLPQGIFKDLEILKSLNLAQNKLNSLPDEVFSSLKNLENLDLSNNQLTVINQNLFEQLFGLRQLKLQRNEISSIEIDAFSAFQNGLRHLDLSYNRLNFFQYGSKDHMNLEELILSHNLIEKVPDFLPLLPLKETDLSYNRIKELPIQYLMRSTRFTFKIDLRNNSIEQIDFLQAERLSKENPFKYNASTSASTILTLANNPIVCDCSNYDLVRYNNDEMKELKMLVDILQDGLVCSNKKTIKVADFRLSHVDCPVIDSCPDPCKCSYKPYNIAVIIDCSHKNLSSYPVLHEVSFNQICLNLSGNNLKIGPSAHVTSYSYITNLDLSNNMISSIDWIPPNIRDLNLNDNLIKHLDKDFVHKLRNVASLERLRLGGNPWECSCKSLELQKYLIEYSHKVNSSDVYCQEKHARLIKLIDICKVSKYLLILLPTVTTIFMCFAVACALYYRYQTEIKVFLFARKWLSRLVTKEEVDKDKTYDVFVCYAHKDEEFVIKYLLPELEHGEHPFKVCIPIRDWMAGSFIAEQIVKSVKDSRRTLVILSNNFVDSVWGKMEFRTAHTEAMSVGRVRVIVLIYGDLDESKLDDELKAYLKTNTYVKWGEKYFWNKLRYALPHSRNCRKEKTHANVMPKIGDTLDIINNPSSPTNTTTPLIILDPSLLEGKDVK